MAEDNIKNKESPILLGVIPARGGSKGIKNKNLRTVLNKPLISYTIKDALSYKKIYKTIVTTDSLKIADEAKKYGAEVPFIRPKRLAKDNTPMIEVLKHALMKCEQLYSLKINGIVLLDPTSPVRKKENINEMIDIFLENKPDLVVAVTKSRRNPYFNMVKINKSGYARLVLKGNFVRRQDAPPIHDITNNCWIFSRQAILRGWRIPRKTIAYETDGLYIDIDEEDDLKLFECFLKSQKRIEKKE